MTHKKLRRLFPALCVAVGAVGSCGVFAADGLTINVGADYSSGKYGGTERTSIVGIPLSAKYTTGPVTLRVSVPWLHISGTGAVIPSGLGGIGSSSGTSGSGSGSGGSVGVFGCAADNRSGARKPEDNGPCATTAVGLGTVAAVRRTEEGFGDVVAAVAYNALNANGLLLDITGKIKFATASETRGLGSGKTDYALQLEAEKTLGKGYFNGGIGYKWLGEPTGVPLRNVWYGSFGGGLKLADNTTVGVSYDYARSARSGGTAGQELSLYASQRLSKNVKLNGNVFRGLSNASPDWGLGVNLGYSF